MPSFSIHYLSEKLLKEKLNISNSNYFYTYLERYRIERSKLDRKKDNEWKILVLIEDEYIDKYYLKDYSKYYVEGFSKEDKFTKRIHFFLSDMHKDTFEKKILKVLSTGDKELIQKINKLYLGHLVRKPIRDKDDFYLVGRTNLIPYPTQVPNNQNVHRRFITYSNDFSLFGIDLSIQTLPFHQQDIAVGACASAALWVTQFAIKNFHSIPIRSLAEITEVGKFWYDLPTYPNEGLKIDELCKYITDIGLPFHIIEIEELYNLYLERYGKKPTSIYIDKLIEDTINAYIPAKFPIICLLHLINIFKKQKIRGDILDDDYHAAVITGYREENGRISELYLHDDQIGPYCKTEILRPMIFLKNKWNEEFEKIMISVLLIPVDPLIKLSFTRIYEEYIGRINDELINNNFKDYWIYLSHISSYKRKLLNNKNVKRCIFFEREEKSISKKILPKESLLQANFPKYIWVIRFFGKNDKLEKDVILDSTTTLWKELARIEYN